MTTYLYTNTFMATSAADADQMNANFRDARNFALTEAIKQDGGVMTNPLILSGNPSADAHAINALWTRERLPMQEGITLGSSSSSNSNVGFTIQTRVCNSVPLQGGIIDVMFVCSTHVTTTSGAAATARIQLKKNGTSVAEARSSFRGDIMDDKVDLNLCWRGTYTDAEAMTFTAVFTNMGTTPTLTFLNDGRVGLYIVYHPTDLT